MSSLLNHSEKVHLTIRPTSGWQALNLQEIWQFRDLLVTLAGRDIKLRLPADRAGCALGDRTAAPGRRDFFIRFRQGRQYASPVSYAVSTVPASLRHFYFLNPLSGLLEAFRWSLLGRGAIPWGFVAYSAVVTIAVSIIGAFAFKKMERRFADVI